MKVKHIPGAEVIDDSEELETLCVEIIDSLNKIMENDPAEAYERVMKILEQDF